MIGRIDIKPRIEEIMLAKRMNDTATSASLFSLFRSMLATAEVSKSSLRFMVSDHRREKSVVWNVKAVIIEGFTNFAKPRHHSLRKSYLANVYYRRDFI